MILKLQNEKLTVSVNTLGAEIISVIGTDGFEYIWNGEHWSGHAPLLFPVCGSLLDNKYSFGGKEYSMAKHGFARRSEFEVKELSDTRAVLSLSASEATRAIYPFEFTLTAEYSIQGNRLSAVFTVKNCGEGVMPFAFGWHPAFNLGGEGDIEGFYVDFGCDGPLVMHPLANGPFLSGEEITFPLSDGAYRLNEKQIYENDTLILTGSAGSARLYGFGDIHEVTLSWSDNLPYLCIWKWPDSTARYLCLEPWTNVAADGITPENFDTRVMQRLGGGESASYEYTVDFQK